MSTKMMFSELELRVAKGTRLFQKKKKNYKMSVDKTVSESYLELGRDNWILAKETPFKFSHCSELGLIELK